MTITAEAALVAGVTPCCAVVAADVRGIDALEGRGCLTPRALAPQPRHSPLAPARIAADDAPASSSTRAAACSPVREVIMPGGGGWAVM